MCKQDFKRLMSLIRKYRKMSDYETAEMLCRVTGVELPQPAHKPRRSRRTFPDRVPNPMSPRLRRLAILLRQQLEHTRREFVKNCCDLY